MQPRQHEGELWHGQDGSRPLLRAAACILLLVLRMLWLALAPPPPSLWHPCPVPRLPLLLLAPRLRLLLPPRLPLPPRLLRLLLLLAPPTHPPTM